MKKNFMLFVMAVVSVVICVGCQTAEVKNSNLPEWVLVPPEGGITSVGSAKVGAAGMGLAKVEATANARDEIARSLNVKIRNMIKNFTETTGVGDDQTVDKVFTNVSKQVAMADLSGTVVKKAHFDQENNELYILVALNPEAVTQVADSMRKAALTTMKNEKALWQKFQGKKGQEELDAEIKKEFGVQ